MIDASWYLSPKPFLDSFPEKDIPSDLKPFYRQLKSGAWAYICPCCKYIYPPGYAGMPGAFRTHLQDYFDGKGCFFNQKAKASQPPPDKHQKAAKDY